ncbi:MAG: serine/threonine-protein phosphatase, partial [Clostridiales bacterium]|nr:serine/threonine-protein phosphatase [Clostridiales bacterium]
MQVSFISHVGEVRKNNEDSVLCREDAGLFAVADGIGGLDNGEFASAAAIYEIEKLAEEEPEDIPSSLREAFYRANDLIHGVGSGKEKHGMGTTLTVACLKDDRIYLA